MKDVSNQKINNKNQYSDIKFDGEVYKDMTDLCDSYNTSKPTIYGKVRNGMTVQDAIKQSINKQIKYNGKTYNHIRALAKDNNMSYAPLLAYIRKAESTELGIQEYLNNYRQANITVWGKSYETFLDIEKTYGLDEGSLYIQHRIYEDVKIEDLIMKLLNQGITFRGKKYTSITNLSGDYGILAETVYNRLTSGWSLESAITEPIANINSNSVITNYRGIEYQSKSELYREYGVGANHVRRLAKKTNNWLDAFDLIVRFLKENNLDNHKNRPNVINYPYMVIYNDVWYEHLRDFAKKCNVKVNNITYTSNRYQVDHLSAMGIIKDKTVPRYKVDGKIYKRDDIIKLMKIGTDKFNEYVKTGIIEKIEYPQYPECTFNPTSLCFSYKHEFDKFIENHI